MLKSAVVAKYPQLKLCLKHSEQALFVDSSSILSDRPGHRFLCPFVLLSLFSGEIEGVDSVLLIWKIKQFLCTTKAD
jgi:hypothetical protein